MGPFLHRGVVAIEKGNFESHSSTVVNFIFTQCLHNFLYTSHNNFSVGNKTLRKNDLIEKNVAHTYAVSVGMFVNSLVL